ncbi:MAG: hypothetical protein ACI4QI_03050 [Candidatus Coproplasma sp.]
MNTELLNSQPAVNNFYNTPTIKKQLDSADPVRGAFEIAYSDYRRSLREAGKTTNRKQLKAFIYMITTAFYYNMIDVRKDFYKEAFDVNLVGSCYKMIDGVKDYGYEISLGQAQKIINVFFKLMLIVDERVNDIIHYLHVPLDDVILKGIAESKELGTLCNTAKKLMPYEKIADEEKYMELQNGLSYEYIEPILWCFTVNKSFTKRYKNI